MKTESQEQIEVIQWCKRNTGKYPELDLIHHIPNGGKRNIAVASRLKLEGVKPGVPDLSLPVPNQRFHGLYVEMKRAKGGSLSKFQKKWFKNLKAQGYAVVRANGSKIAIDLIMQYLKMER